MIGQRVTRELTSTHDERDGTLIHMHGNLPVVMYDDGTNEIVGWRQIRFHDPAAVRASLSNTESEMDGDLEVTLER